MSYLFYSVLSILFNIICYITNPIVCLFANEVGQLPKALRYWQTWDNPLDIEWMISEEIVPKIFRYDFNKHYIYHYEEKNNFEIKPGYVELIDPNFTIKERIQRYFCRLAWMYRNTAYGFDHEVTSKKVIIKNIDIKKQYYIDKYNQLIFSVDSSTPWYNKTFKLYYYKRWSKKFYLRIYLGWKLTNSKENPEGIDIAMLALFINPFRMVK